MPAFSKRRIARITTFTVHHNKHVSSRPFEAGRRFLQAYRLTQAVVQTMLRFIGIKPIDAALLAKAGESPAA